MWVSAANGHETVSLFWDVVIDICKRTRMGIIIYKHHKGSLDIISTLNTNILFISSISAEQRNRTMGRLYSGRRPSDIDRDLKTVADEQLNDWRFDAPTST